jgi:hypothetical protein
MKEEVLFSERQRFTQWWVWLLITGVSALAVFQLVYQLRGTGETAGLFIGCGVVLLVNALLLFIRLDTVIKQDGFYVRFFPFHRRFKHFSWSNIGQIQLRKYSPLGEYGGWGMRLGRGAGKAYTISGNKGIQLLLNDGSKLLIGTSRQEEVKQVLQKLNR